jgi:hypothetical protein
VGRGLSELQESILLLALRNHRLLVDAGRAEVPDEETGRCSENAIDVYLHEAGRAYYHKELYNPLDYHRRWLAPRWTSASERVAVCRAFGRLQKRGFVSCHYGAIAKWSGASLTPYGIHKAKELSVNKRTKWLFVNRYMGGPHRYLKCDDPHPMIAFDGRVWGTRQVAIEAEYQLIDSDSD